MKPVKPPTAGPGRALAILRTAASDWNRDDVPRLAAALAFYTMLSLAPLVVIGISVIGVVLDRQAARTEVVTAISSVMGPRFAAAVGEIIDGARFSEAKGLAAALGIAVLLFGASGVFGELQKTMNLVWNVPQRSGGGILRLLRERFFSFGMVLGAGFLLLVSLLLSAGLAASGRFLSGRIPGGEALWEVVNALVSFAVVSLLFALMFKYLPATKVRWRDVWGSAIFTAVLFTLGKFAIGFYLGKSAVASTFGAAGALAVVLVWVYYSAQILFFGAELTQVIATSSPQSQAEGAAGGPDTSGGTAAAVVPATTPAKERGGALPLILGTVIVLAITRWTSGKVDHSDDEGGDEDDARMNYREDDW